MRRVGFISAGLLLAAAGLFLLVGDNTALPVQAAPSRTVTLFFSGWVQGSYGPCGWPVNPTGGLARRAGYTHKFAKDQGNAIVQVDLGNYFAPLGPGSDIVNNMMIDSLNGLPLKVMNLASEDLHLWKQLAAAKLQTKIISTNLVPKDPSVPSPAPFAIVEIPGQNLGIKRNVKIGFLGLANPAAIKPKSDFTAVDPVEAIEKVKPLVANQADFLVVLADVPKSVAIRVANAHPEVMAILMAEKAYMRHNPEQVNNAVLLWSIEKGRNLGRLDLELNDSAQVTTFKPSEVVLDATVPEDATLLKRQKEIAAQVPASVTH